MAIVMMIVIACYLSGLLFSYSNSNPAPYAPSLFRVSPQPFASINPGTLQIVMLALEAFTGLWMIFFFNGITSFILSSTATIWYFSNSTVGETPHRPLTTSMARFTKYHQGTVAFGSLVLGLFFLIRLISAFFKASPDRVSENRCFNCCIKCLTCFGSVFNL
jgi:solute carrier family 44 protein 1 (choline transporter-like protein)